MTPAPSRVDAGMWSIPGHATVIEYSRPVLNEILTQVVDAFEAYFAGGYEVGGVLYGEHSGGTVRIRARRPLPIHPPRPSFVLSKQDEGALKQLLEARTGDPELAGLIPVGWYHSHTRSEIFLSESDLEIYDTWFPEPWQIALVFRPSEEEPVRAGFFFRESDGFIRADQSYQEISFDPPQRRAVRRQRPPWEITDDGDVVEPELPAVMEAELALLDARPREPMIAVAPPEPDRSWRDALPSGGAIAGGKTLRWGAAALGGAVFMALAVSYLIESRAPGASLGLDVLRREGDLYIRWNGAAAAMADPDTAALTIHDGGRRVERPLSPVQLQRGQEIYRPASPRVDVRLQLNRSWGRSRQEIATYLAHPDRGKPVPELVEAREQLADTESEVNRLRGELLGYWQGSEKLQARVDELTQREQQLTAVREDTARREEAARRDEAQRREDAQRREEAQRREDAQRRLEAARKAEAAKPAPAPAAPKEPAPVAALAQAPKQELRFPVEAPKPVAPAPAYTPVPAPSGVNAPAASSAAPVTAPKPQAPTGPASGRFLWTGDLPRNGQLVIDGRSASTGLVTGELPGTAVRIGAYPAELSGRGMRVFTTNPRLAAEPRNEAPAAGNGWNRTTYTYDQRAVRDVIVEQLPSTGAPRKLVLRAGARNVSVIVIEWQVVTP